MRLRSFDLIVAGLVALFTLGMAVTGSLGTSPLEKNPAWFMPFGMLMVLIVPGYVITMSILPHLDRATTLLLSLGISLSLDVIGGLILHYTPWGLTPASWAVWLSSITMLGCVIAAFHRSRLPKTESLSSTLPKWNWKLATSLILTGLLLFAALGMAMNAAIQAGTTFTQLWALPANDATGYSIQIGIHSEEKGTEHYDLFVESRGITLTEWPDITLAPGETRTSSLFLGDKPNSDIQILLYKAGALTEAYRSVHLVPASFDSILPSPTGQ
jgi:hypothetical protein